MMLWMGTQLQALEAELRVSQLDFPLGLIAVLVLNHILDPLTEIGTVRAERGVAMASG